MMEGTIGEASPVAPVAPNETEKQPNKPWFKIIGFAVLGVVLVGGLVFAVYKFAWVQQKREQTPSSRKELDGCRRGEDCIWAIRLDSCCACPEIASRTALGSNLVEYKPSEDYFLKKTVDCRNIACEPCEPLPEKIFCREGKCRTEKQAVSDPTAGWKTYRNTRHGFELKYPAAWQITTSNVTESEKETAIVKLIKGPDWELRISATKEFKKGECEMLLGGEEFEEDGYKRLNLNGQVAFRERYEEDFSHPDLHTDEPEPWPMMIMFPVYTEESSVRRWRGADSCLEIPDKPLKLSISYYSNHFTFENMTNKTIDRSVLEEMDKIVESISF